MSCTVQSATTEQPSRSISITSEHIFCRSMSEPDRWTFLDEDYSKPVPGREMPGDAFAFPDTGGDHAFVIAKQAKIIPKTGVSFKPARIYTFGAYTPTPEYYANFSPNPYFAENSLAGATGRRRLSVHRLEKLDNNACTDVTTPPTALSCHRGKSCVTRTPTRSSPSIRSRGRTNNTIFSAPIKRRTSDFSSRTSIRSLHSNPASLNH